MLRFEDGGSYKVDDAKAIAGWLDGGAFREGGAVQARPHPDAGFHRRAGGGRSGGDARRHHQARRQPGEGEPAGAGGPGDRPLGAGRCLRHGRTRLQKNVEIEFERNGERYRFLRWGQEAFDNFRVVPPGTGICHQVNLEYLGQCVWTADRRRHDFRLSGHAVRHRQPHHDGERPWRAGLGRRRHRGGGGDARPADRHADPRRDRLPPDRPAAGGRHRHRPGADRHADAAQQGRGRKVRRVLRAGAGSARPRRPRHDRQHGAGIRRDLRLLPGGHRWRSTICT